MTKLAPTAVKFGINILAVLFVLFLNSALHAQIGINVPANESPQAQLDIRQGANNLPGMLIPKVSSLPQASAGETIAEGLMVFLQGENPNFYVFVNGSWQTIAESSGVETTTEITVVTINEGYFETDNDGWTTFGRSARVETNFSCEQQHSMEIRDDRNGSRIELQNVDLTDYTLVTVDFEYKTTTNWESDDYFTFKLNGSELGRFYESQTCTSASITINSSDYSFGSSDTFKFEGEMSSGEEKVYIDAVVIKGYTDTVCETSFENDYGCWVNGNNTSRTSSNANTGSYSVQFDGNNGNDSYIETESPIDASAYSFGLISLYYDGNNEVESSGSYGDYLIIQSYNTSSSSWEALPDATFGVNRNYTLLQYAIPSVYLTSDLRIRIVFDATASDEYMYLDDTVILIY